MGDINRSGSDLVKYNDVMRKMHLQILINEKINLLKQLEVRLDHIMTVEVKQIELKREELKTEIVSIQQELNPSNKIIELEGE